MAKSKRERRSSIRHMQADSDVLAIFDALDKAESPEPETRPTDDATEPAADDSENAATAS